MDAAMTDLPEPVGFGMRHLIPVDPRLLRSIRPTRAAVRPAHQPGPLDERQVAERLPAGRVRLYVPFHVGDRAARIPLGSRGGGLSVR